MKGVSAVACVAFVLLAPAGPAGAAEPDAKAVYLDKCLACHGETGAPTPPFAKRGVKDLSSPEWQASEKDEEIRDAIAKGAKDTLMRAFEKELDDATIDALVGYVRTLKREAGS
jgi:mono/diheme cytochrome c family protein